MFVYKIKKIVVILSMLAYNELEVSNLQTAVDTCQCLVFLYFLSILYQLVIKLYNYSFIFWEMQPSMVMGTIQCSIFLHKHVCLYLF